MENDNDESAITPAAIDLTGAELFGQPLRAYSGMRYVIMQAMGMLWPYPGEGAIAQMLATGMYPGIMKDVAILFWVLLLKEPSEQTKEEAKAREWNTVRAINNPRDAAVEAVTWAANFGIADVQADKFDAACQLFFAITKPAEDAKFKVDSAQGDAGDESPKV